MFFPDFNVGSDKFIRSKAVKHQQWKIKPFTGAICGRLLTGRAALIRAPGVKATPAAMGSAGAAEGIGLRAVDPIVCSPRPSVNTVVQK